MKKVYVVTEMYYEDTIIAICETKEEATKMIEKFVSEVVEKNGYENDEEEKQYIRECVKIEERELGKYLR